MSLLSLNLFGLPTVEADGQLVEIKRRKALALLAYLAVSGQSYSRAALAAVFWPEADQAHARAALRSALWALNKTSVVDWLVVETETVGLRPASDPAGAARSPERELQTDVGQFCDLLDEVEAHRHAPGEACPGCLKKLTWAIALYHNDFMTGFTLPDAPEFDEWQFFQTIDLRERLAQALVDLITHLSAQGLQGNAIPYARRLVALDPLHEPAQRMLMKLYARTGQKSAAVRQYEICREVMDEQLGLEPSPETTILVERIRSGAWPEEGRNGEGPAAAVDAMATTNSAPLPETIRHNLPPQSTLFVGREQELASLAAFLNDETTRLLTIVGPGGIGKTRLALQAAADQVPSSTFIDGIYFVDLAPFSNPENIVPAIAEAVGYPFQNDQRTLEQQLFDFLGQKTILLLLDNLEQLLHKQQPDGAALVVNLLQNAPNLTVLTTSRERLRLYEEQDFPLDGLAVGDAQGADAGADFAAALLFLQSARRRQPDFEIDPPLVPYLTDICRFVEGMPLALELAASWLDTLSLPEIAAAIQHNLAILTTDIRNVPDRHRSMQAVFDGSWQTLSESEKGIYARLSVFQGGFTQSAAEAIAGASLPVLRMFVSKSLLRFSQRHKRYVLHELLRQYAEEQLAGAAEETRDRHATYYCDFLGQREAHLKGLRQREALAEIAADSQNAGMAFERVAEQAQVSGLDKALTPLAIYYQWYGRLHEGEAMCRLAADRLTEHLLGEEGEPLTVTWTPQLTRQARILVRALTWLGSFHLFLSQHDAAQEVLQRARTLLDMPDSPLQQYAADRAFLLLQLSNLAIIDDFGGETLDLNEQALSVYQSAGDDWGMALALDALSQRFMNQGQHEEAFRLLEECLAVRQRVNDHRGIARTYNSLGLVVLHMGQVERSEDYLRQSLALFRTLDNRAELSNPLAVLGINLLFGGRFSECIDTYEECWALHREMGLPQEPFVADVTVTRAKVNLGRYDEARAQAETKLATYRSSSGSWKIAFMLHNLGRIDLATGNANQALERLQQSASILQKMSERSLLPDVLFCQVYALRALGEREQALDTMALALQIVIETGPLNPMRFELPAKALFLVDEGDDEQAVEYYAAALQSNYIRNSRWFEDIAGRTMGEVTAKLPRGVAAAARKRGQERDLWLTVKAVLAELTGD